MEKKEKIEIKEISDLCSGCDVPTRDAGQYYNGKLYCPRCYEEVKAMFDRKDHKGVYSK